MNYFSLFIVFWNFISLLSVFIPFFLFSEDLICSSFSKFLRWMLRSLIFSFTSLINALRAINSPKHSLTCILLVLISFCSNYFLILIIISSLTHRLLRRILICEHRFSSIFLLYSPSLYCCQKPYIFCFKPLTFVEACFSAPCVVNFCPCSTCLRTMCIQLLDSFIVSTLNVHP